MRRVTAEEEVLKDQPVLKGVDVICALCGARLERDEESGACLCPVCDGEEES